MSLLDGVYPCGGDLGLAAVDRLLWGEPLPGLGSYRPNLQCPQRYCKDDVAAIVSFIER
jgi:hypothetical protein